jgi:hypothetical protein
VSRGLGDVYKRQGKTGDTCQCGRPTKKMR